MSLSFSFKLLLSLILACMSALSLADRITQSSPINLASDATDHTHNSSEQISNKESPVSSNLISARGVVLQVDQSNATIKINHKAGADVIVVGNAIEKDPLLIKEISIAVHEQSVSSKKEALQ